MLEVLRKDIPRESSLVIEPDIDQETLASLFEAVEDFDLVEPEAFDATLRIQRMDEASIRVAGYVAARVGFECGRCLERRVVDLDAELEYVLVPRVEFEERYLEPARRNEELELEEEDLNVDYYEGEEIDLRPLVREALLLELPPFSVCPDSLSEQCQRDYEQNVAAELDDVAELDDEEEQADEDVIDPRWAKLAALKKERAQAGAGGGDDEDTN